ncbi:MAG: PaaI family thioesterase [Cytophagaceae bacterium]|nr:PaaI family thioesterase [Gemmatimonadaceae bacterium]
MDPIRERIQASFDRQSFMQHIGATLARVERGFVELSVRRDDRHLQQHGFLHAGVITSALDSACGYAALTVMDDDAAVLSVEFKVNLLAPAAGELFVARGTVLKAGRTVVVCRGDAFVVDGGSERLIAAMQATLMTVRGRDLKD